MQDTETLREKYNKLSHAELVVLQVRLQEQQVILKSNDIWTERTKIQSAMLKKKLAVIHSIFTAKKHAAQSKTRELEEVTKEYISETLENFGIYNPILEKKLIAKLIARSPKILPDYALYITKKGMLHTVAVKAKLIKSIIMFK